MLIIKIVDRLTSQRYNKRNVPNNETVKYQNPTTNFNILPQK
jgi:hypothetical protein